ncbi:unnamed protein product [Rotaria socialis]|uniref:Transcriptional regulator ATRX-like protein n=1 Tax=Rotaria socialis TaxID=392032 RepID=A0A817QMM4_9BILA|nr:unnamed protein product [Rotaria socialis]
MKTNTNKLLVWLKEFQNTWLLENIPNDNHLVDSIKIKLDEFEQLIIEISDDEEEYNRAKLLSSDSPSNSDTEELAVASTSTHEALLAPPDIRLPIENATEEQEEEEEQSRRLLLAESDASEKSASDDEDELTIRPTIRLKRISQADAERYMPLAWKNIRSKSFSYNSDSSTSHEKQLPSSLHSNNLQQREASHLSNSNNEISSNNQIRNSTSAHDDSESSTSDDDFTIKVRTEKCSSNRTEKSPTKSHKREKRSHKKHDVIINYNLTTAPNEASLDETSIQEPIAEDSLTIVDDMSPIDEDPILKDVIDNNDNDSIFGSLDIAQDKLRKQHSNEDAYNDEIDSLPGQDSPPEELPTEVPSYAHLLNQSKLSSDSGSEDSKNDAKKNSPVNEKSQSNKTKRTTRSSSNSDSSIIKKKSKLPIKQRAALSSFSSSSSSDENESNSATLKDGSNSSPKQSSSTSSRIRIQRSLSENSNSSLEISRKRRRKSDTLGERSSILKQLKRITKDKKNLTSNASSDSNENSHDSENPTKSKKAKVKFSDDSSTDDDDDDDGELSPSKRKLGRKNIRKIIDDQELHDQTRNAIEAERERRNRIAEKQKEYNESLLEQSSYMSTSVDDELNSSNRRLILELDTVTNEPLIEVAPKLVEQLKPHQLDGIRFLWNNVFESMDAIKNKKHNGNGCILAHCMGLGKTLQVISFIHTVFNYDKITNVKTCLVLCPINAALNWSNEFDHWLKDVEPSVDHYQLTTVKPNLRVTHLEYWHKHGGVAIMGYEIYRRLANGIGIKNKKLKADAYTYLVDPGPDIVVADEGHILKNAQTALAKCLSKIKTPRRIVLTGTPLQNNLIEYYCMVSFIKPKLLGSQPEYINRFVNPIQNGQHRDSNEEDVRLMKRRACVLHELLTGFVDRKDYSLLQEYLPPKFEYIINIRLSDLQSKLYEIYLKQQVDQCQRSSVLKKDFKSAKLFADYQYLQKIWTHPFLLYPHFIDRWKKRLNTDDESLIDDTEIALLIDDEESIEGLKKKKTTPIEDKSPEEENAYSGFLIENIKNEITDNQSTTKKRNTSNSSTTTLDSDSANDIDNLNEDIDLTSKSTNSDDDIEIIRTYSTRSRASMNNQSKNILPITTDSNVFDVENDPSSGQADDMNEPWFDEISEQFWFPFLNMLPKESKFDIELGGKILLLKFIIDKCAEIGDKILLFSRSLYALNYIESFLKHLHSENEKEYLKQCESRRQLQEILASTGDNNNVANEYISPPVEWVRDQDYFRMDGQTEVLSRKRYAKSFNDPSNPRARLFLISTLAGGIGINLTGSNRVIVFDASWNPSHDTQAIFRSYRFGQKKPVYIYRLLAHGTMEEKIYQRQVVKQSISQRVVDDHQLDRHFTQSDIKELYKFKSEPLPEARPASTLLTQSATDFNYPIPKDHLLLDLLYEHSRWIHSYHSHDSLLENKIDEGLSVEERRRALEEYENLKRGPDLRQIAMQRFQQQQLNAHIAQQQQLAAAHMPRNLQPNMNQMISDIYKNFQQTGGQGFDFARALQHIHDMESARGLTNNATNNKRMPQSNMNQNRTVPIRPRPMSASTTNDIILVDSDDETGNDEINTLSI